MLREPVKPTQPWPHAAQPGALPGAQPLGGAGLKEGSGHSGPPCGRLKSALHLSQPAGSRVTTPGMAA